MFNFNPADEYCGHEAMQELLKKVGSQLTIFELYGLFYGCLAATNLVTISQYMPLIFGKEEPTFESDEEANKFFSNLMRLWNILAGWEPANGPFILPEAEYPPAYAGLKQQINDSSSMSRYFIKGLDVGGTDETDFSEDALKALESLARIDIMLSKYAELIDAETQEDKVENKTRTLIKKAEFIIFDCIARINLGLKEARVKAVERMRLNAKPVEKTYRSEGKKIKRNELCPCGSGKKHKKCCGMLH